MKLFYTAFFAVLFNYTAMAETFVVTVSNFQFSPSTVNAIVGDVIQFNWTSGNHTTTCGSALDGTTLPAGAPQWDAVINSGNTTFSYTLTVAGTYFYGCTPHFDGGDGMAGTLTVSGPLPVKLGTFSVSNEKNTALLQWQTFSESNVDYFSIRKSTDGTHFNEIGTVKAAGNSGRTLNYTFPDHDLGSIYKYLYYDIVIVDKDKKETFSAIRSLRNNAVMKDNLIVALGPNPVTRPAQVQLMFNADQAGQMDVAVFNVSGQRVLKTKMAAFYGLNSAHLHICDLGKGTYNIVFTLAGKKEIVKVVVL